MREMLLAMPSPLGFSMANNAPSFCPTVKSLYAKLGDYRLLQDQARPEYAVLYTGERVATVTLEPVKDLAMVSYLTPIDSAFELLWLKSVPLPDSITSQLVAMTSSRNSVNYMVKVSTDSLPVVVSVFDEMVAANTAVLLRLNVNLTKSELESINVELIDGDTIDAPEGKAIRDHYIVSSASDEIVGSVSKHADDVYSIKLVTADVLLAAAFLAVCKNV